MKRLLTAILVITLSLLSSIPAFAGPNNASVELTERQINIFRAYGLSENEISNITSERIQEVIRNSKIVDYSFLVKTKPSYENILAKDLTDKIKKKGLNDKQIDALMDLGYRPAEIAEMDEAKIKDVLSKTEVSLDSVQIIAAVPPNGYNKVAVVPDGGGYDEWFHPNVDVSPSAIDFYVEASKLCAVYMFNDWTPSHLAYSYNLWGEWGEDAQPTWCHEGVDLQDNYYGRGRAVKAVASGVVKLKDPTWGAVMIYNPTLGVTYNYQHMTGIPPSITVGSQITLGQQIGNQSDVNAPGAVHTHIGVNNGSYANLDTGRDLNLQTSEPYTAMIYFIP